MPKRRDRNERETRWNFILDRRADLIWYIGSSLAGWCYVGLVLWLGRGMEHPTRDPFLVLKIGDWRVPLTLGLVVVASWAFLLDAPHLWATLARTWLDPEEWSKRRGVLLGSLSWFAVGPIAVFGPYMVALATPLDASTIALTHASFFALFRLWAYYHVVRQHWGFLALYKRRNDDLSDPVENRADSWFFHATLYLPVILLLAAPWAVNAGVPDLGLSRTVLGGRTLASISFWLISFAYAAVVLGYVSFQLRRYRRGVARNGPKLLFLFSIVPLHLVVFLHPLLVLFVVPVVTVGHNLQYLRIVWAYGRAKYAARSERRFRWARFAFRSVPVYVALGLVFTFLLYRGPWVDFLQTRLASAIDGLGMVAGMTPSHGTGLGARVAATLFLGWAMQHYYLDSKIWQLRKDPEVAKTLGVS